MEIFIIHNERNIKLLRSVILCHFAVLQDCVGTGATRRAHQLHTKLRARSKKLSLCYRPMNHMGKKLSECRVEKLTIKFENIFLIFNMFV